MKKSIRILPNGPYQVDKEIPLNLAVLQVNEEEEATGWEFRSFLPQQKEEYHLCRCGQSKTFPFCDGTHTENGFDGKETASREPFETQAVRYEGIQLDLLDLENLCVGVKICLPHGNTWKLTRYSDNPKFKRIALQQSADCPSGRLVSTDKENRPIEPTLPQEISLIIDPHRTCYGAYWVRGGIEIIGIDGEPYEIRNRVTLCGCGSSKNIPFCDASHYSVPSMSENYKKKMLE